MCRGKDRDPFVAIIFLIAFNYIQHCIGLLRSILGVYLTEGLFKEKLVLCLYYPFGGRTKV